LTIRVNTFKRNDLLSYFLGYYSSKLTRCPIIKEIQVIWSDIDESPPKSLLDQYSASPIGSGNDATTDTAPRISFEIHSKNSLTNRFRPSLDIKTDAVLSIDDDLIVPCEYLKEMIAVRK
jgi:hypothetical protein